MGVGVVRRALAAVELVLPEVEAVVGGEEEVRVRSGLGAEPADHPVDRLHHPGAVAVAGSGRPGRSSVTGLVFQAGAGRGACRCGAGRSGRCRPAGRRTPCRSRSVSRRTAWCRSCHPSGRPVGARSRERRRERRVVGVGLRASGRAGRRSRPRGSTASSSSRCSRRNSGGPVGHHVGGVALVEHGHRRVLGGLGVRAQLHHAVLVDVGAPEAPLRVAAAEDRLEDVPARDLGRREDLAVVP